MPFTAAQKRAVYQQRRAHRLCPSCAIRVEDGHIYCAGCRGDRVAAKWQRVTAPPLSTGSSTVILTMQ